MQELESRPQYTLQLKENSALYNLSNGFPRGYLGTVKARAEGFASKTSIRSQ